MADFDFDKWRALAQTSPDEFERERQCVLENLIEKAENRRQLQGLQCRIDLERAKARTPNKSYLRLSTLMWEAFFDFRAVMNEKGIAKKRVGLTQAHEAKIIPFHGKQKLIPTETNS